MILLDTMVVAEALRPAPQPKVIAWLNSQQMETMYISAISAAELLRDISKLWPWQRETARGSKMSDRVLELFADRVLAFDLTAARQYGRIMSEVRRGKFSISRRDCFIAATAASYNIAVATHNGSPFLAAGLHVQDPWWF